MAYPPLVVDAGHDDDGVHFCDEGHELVAYAGIDEDGADFGVQGQ
jgi:hypothetical protein